MPPLAGTTVADLTRYLPGPFASRELLRLGARVVKIEPPAGDPSRTATPEWYRALNDGKEVIAWDARTEPPPRVLLEADVVLEGFRPGVWERLGVELPGTTILCSITGFGADGPHAAQAGHDLNYLGYAGVLDQTGARDGAPALCNVQIADLLGGAASTAIAILAALLGAQRTGRGRYVDVSMTDASLAHNLFSLHALERWGHVVPRGSDLLTGGVPCYGVYPTQDGRWLAVGALEEKFWKALCDAIERPDLAAVQFALGEEGAHVRGELERVFGAQTLAYWTEKFAVVDCCVTPVQTLDEAMSDRQFIARDMIRMRDDGSRELAPPFKVSGHEFSIARQAPAHGEHSALILREAGYDAEAIAAMIAAGVVRIS